MLLVRAQAAQTNLAATVRHAPGLNGRIEGSLQQLLGEDALVNSGFVLTGDLYLPGVPSLVLNGQPSYSGTIVGSGSSSPSGYHLTLNSGCSLGYVRTRINPVTLPTVPAPPQPAGTRNVTLSSPGQSYGSASTLRDLTLNANVGQVSVPAGTYGTFTAGSGSGFTLGVSGATQPASYNFQNLNLNSGCRLDVIGPIILKVANGFSANGILGSTNHSSWLQLQVASGGFTINSACTLHGNLTVPAGTVIIDNNGLLVGTVQSDRLTVNGGGVIRSGASANQPPVANGQNLSVAEESLLNITLAGSDPEGAALLYTLLSQPAHGVLTGTAPNLVYHPATNFNGADSFSFKVNDGQADSAAATISITVTPVNDAPVVLAQNLSTPEDTALPITLTGTDVENNPLTFRVVTSPTNGTLSGVAPNLVYLPATNYDGHDSFTFTANDGQTNSVLATVSITVNVVDDAPVAAGKAVTTDEDTPVAITLSAVDVEGDGLVFALLTQPQHGVLSGTPPDLIYTPATNYNGNDSFTFDAFDGWLYSDPATMALIIRQVNDAPVAGPQTLTTLEDTATNIVLTGTDVEGDFLSFTVVTPPVHGALYGSPPQLIYSPAADYHGTDSFTFMVNDGKTNSMPAMVNLVITPVNDAPVAQAAAVTTEEDTSMPVALKATDVDGDALTFAIVTLPTNGTLSGTAPNLIYQPATNHNGLDSFIFIANDGQTNSAPATVSITITPVNDAPTAYNQSTNTQEDAAVNVILAGNDVENDRLTYTIVTPPGHGTLSLQPSTLNQYLYTPTANYNGSDSFTFTTFDGALTSSPATVVVQVVPVNDPPVANPRQLTLLEDISTNVVLQAADVDGDSLTYSVMAPPAHGTLTGTPPFLFYTPAPDYNGSDSFTFVANDGQANSAPATVSLTILPVNDAPVARQQLVATDENTPVTITLTGTDADGDALSFAITTQPSHGTLNLQPLTLNSYIYNPATGHNGPDNFTFKANDGRLDSAPATVTIDVHAGSNALQLNVPGDQETLQDVPLAFEGERQITVRGSTAGSLTLSLSVTNGTLTLGSTNGLIVISGVDGTSSVAVSGSQNDLNSALNGLTYLGNPAFVGIDTIVLMVENPAGSGSIDSKVVPITVLPRLTYVSPFAGAVRGTPFPITYDSLFWSSDISYGVSYKVESLTSGTLTKDGHPLEFGTSLISPGESVAWTPPSDAVGQVEAFRVVAWDGSHQSSNPVPVYVEAHAPMHLNVPGGQSTPYNMPLAFGTKRLISIVDDDVGLGVLELSLSVSSGTLTLGRGDVLDWQAGANGTSTLVVRGTLADLNAALVGLKYLNSSGFSGADLLNIAVDDLGNNGLGVDFKDAKTIPITVIASPNNPPKVSIVVPVNASQFQFGQAIAVEATAVDSDGQLTNVTLLADGLQFAELAGPPFATTWTGATLGRHILSATATDDHGATSVSTDVSIWVVDENGDFSVDAGPDQIISLPGAAFLVGTVAIPTPVADAQTNVTWSMLDGPGDVQFSDPNALITTAQFSEPGSYTLRLLADCVGGTRSDLLRVDVLAAPPDRLTATRSSKGTDFWLTFLNNIQPYTEVPYIGCDLYISADVDTIVKVNESYDGTERRFQIPAGSSIRVPTYFPTYYYVSDSILPNAVHVTADHPVSVHGLNYLTYSTDGFLALPTAMLGTDYIILAYRNSPSWSNPDYVDGGTEFAVVASENDTHIIIVPSATADSRVANVPYEIILQQGETYRLINYDGPNADFTGTTIKSDKPVAVLGGHVCALVPASTPAGDHLVEELPPVNTWGRHFVTMPLATRTKGDTFRFLAATNGTRLAINGKIVASLDRGQFYEQIIDGPAEILASQPVLAAQYANGSDFDGTTGDPFMMLIPPFEQFGGDYILSTAHGVVWQGFPPSDVFTNNYVNLTVRTNGVGTILLDDVPVPAGCFQLIGNHGYAGAQVPVSPGAHHFSAPVPFGVCVYGWAPYESYAFMGGFYSESVGSDTKLELIQATPFAAVGHEKTMFAQATDGRGLPLTDLEITFSVAGANVVTGKVTTSHFGKAAFSYIGTNAGMDLVTANLADLTQSLTNTWIADSDNTPPAVSTANIPTRQYSRTVELAGSVTDDNRPAGGHLQIQWQLLNGPAEVQFENATQSVTHAFCSQSGRYEFELSADDSQFGSHASVSVLVDDVPEIFGYGIPSLIPVGSPVGFQVDAWDDDDNINRVEFYANGSLIGTASPPDWGAGYGINWTPSTNGWFQIRATAFDGLGGSNSLDLGTIQVGYPPQVSIDSPGNGAVLTVPTNVSVHATAHDQDGTIVSVSIYINGSLLETSDGSDATANWFPRQPGNYTLVAIATDDLGLTSVSDDVLVKVTGDFPQVTLHLNYTNEFGQPYIRLPYGVPFDLQADAWMTGPYHITNVIFYADGQPIGSLLEPPYQISWTYQSDYSGIKVVAESDSGVIGEDDARLRIYGLVSLAFATPGTNKLAVGTAVAIRLAVEDPGHIVDTFDYFVNGQLLAEMTNSDPVFWQPPAPGRYQIRARARERIQFYPPPDEAVISVTANFAFLNGVSIVSPNDGDSLYVGSPAPIYLAFDDPTGDFDHAEIFTNGASLGQTTNSWFEWVPQQTNDYSLTAVAYDHQGHASTPSDPVRVHVLTPPPPEIVITSPKDGDRLALGQETLVAVDVNDPAQAVTNLELVVDGVKVADSLNSYIPWTPGSAGTHQLTVVAADWNGNGVTSAPVNVTVVEMHPPTVTITSPADGMHFNAETLPPFGAQASDSDGIVTNLTLELDGLTLGETNGTILELPAINVLGGWHTVLARATDNDGLTGVSTTISFFIDRSEDTSLPVPAQLVAQASSAMEIQLTWQPLPTNTPASSVLVERWDPDLSAWIEIGKAPVTETHYTDSNLNPETCYRYRVATTDNQIHRSAYSAEARATTRTVVPNYSVIDLTEALIASLTGHGNGANILTNCGLNHFDSRRTVALGANHAGSVLGTNATALKLAVARFKEHWPQIQLDFDPVLFSPKSVLPRLGYLTGPGGAGVTVSDATAQQFDPADPDRPVKAFLQEYQALFGFGAEAITDATVQRDYVSAGNGARTVVWQQQVAGVPVFNALLIGHITPAGELACVSSEFIPSPAQAADPAMVAAVQFGAGLPLSSPQAVVAAVNNVGDRLTSGYMNAETDAAGVTRQQTFSAPDGFKGDARAELTWFPAGRSQLRLCWQVLFTSQWRDEMYLTLVAADTGEILYRRNLTAESQQATYRVYTNASPSPLLPGWPTPNATQPSLAERGLVTLTALDDTASPNGWINDGDNETSGNNVDAHLDRNDDNSADLPRPAGNPSRVFDFPLDVHGGPANYGEASTVQLFYWDNWMHDALYQLGFTEGAGNFQADNFGRGGQGNDAVQADAQDGLGLSDGRHANNANMSTPPDGCAPRMQMYAFDGATPARDGSLDAQIVLHEYTHGLSTRLVGGGAGIDALQTAGMGEGWSDFYALALLTDPAADVDGVYPMGSYAVYHGFGTTFEENYYYGIRHYPYCTDTNKNPLTFADIDPWKASAHDGVPRNPLLGSFRADQAGEVHSQGEVWCMMLWEMRANLIRKLGPAAGNNLALQLVTDGLKLSPPNPNFVQARDAILLADRMRSAGANAGEIWSAFAKRGLGYNARCPESYTTTGAQESHDLMPALAVERVEVQTAGGAVELGVNNNLLIHLRNQGDAAATHVSGRLSTTVPGVTVLQSISAYSDIPQGGSRANNALFQIQTGTGFVEGTPIDLAFAITSDQSTGANYLRLFTGVPGADILFDNYSALADPIPASSVSRDLTPWDLGNAEPLWMADDASCLLKLGTGKYVLWKPDGTSYSIVTTNFLAHRLTRNGVVVGTLTVTNTVDEWTNKIAHTVGARWDFLANQPVLLTTNEYYWPKDTPPSSLAGKAYAWTNLDYNQHVFLTNVTAYPTLQDTWDMNSNVVAVGSASVQEPFSWEQILFGADGTMDWFTPSERGLNAGAGTNAVTELRYFALLSTAAQFNTNDWRWLGPLDWINRTAVALLVNDAGMIAGYGGIYTGDPAVDALRPTHAFRAPATGEFDGSGIILTNDLGVLANGLHSFPRAMNQAGEVVGYSDYDVARAGLAVFNPTNFHAVFWALTNRAPDDLHSLQQVTTNDPPTGFSDAYAINDQSQVVGTSWRNAYTALRIVLIVGLDGNGQLQTNAVTMQTNVFVLQPGDKVLQTNAVSVAAFWQRNQNTNGVVTDGASSTTNAPFWEITDLNDRLTDTSWSVFNAVGINSDGLMLANAAKTGSGQQNLAQNPAEKNHAVLLVPAPDFIRAWDWNKLANRSTRAINQALRYKKVFEDSPRSKAGDKDNTPLLVLGAWGNQMAAADVGVQIQLQPTAAGKYLNWEVIQMVGTVDGPTFGTFEKTDRLILHLIPSQQVLAKHEGYDYYVRIGIDRDHDGHLSENECWIPQMGIRVIGKPEYDYCAGKLAWYKIAVGTFIWPDAADFIGVFMNNNIVESYDKRENSTIDFSEGNYDWKCGLGCTPLSLTKGQLPSLTWNRSSDIAWRVLRSDEVWQTISSTIDQMHIEQWFAAAENGSETSHQFSGTFKQDITFTSTGNLNSALHGCQGEFAITVDAQRGSGKPEITKIGVTGNITDLYDFQPGGGDNELDWASRVQVCYAPSCERKAGMIYRLHIDCNVRPFVLSDPVPCDQLNEMRSQWDTMVNWGW